MNLVKLITDQFQDETIGKLSGLLGTDSETAGAAATAAVPALLSGLASMASRGDGAKKLTDVLSGIDANSMGNLAQSLTGDTGGLLQRGTSLLGSLFGDSMISSAASAIGKYAGIGPGTVKSLLAYLLPFVLGKVAGQWKSQGGTTSALASLFADQKRNIAEAVPAGFSLADIPGLAGAGESVRVAAQTTRRAAETAGAASKSAASWLLPLAAVLLGGFLLWNFLRSRQADKPPVARNTEDVEPVTVMKPVLPDRSVESREATDIRVDVDRIRDQVSGILTSATKEFGSIKDAATAEDAKPKLETLRTKLDSLRAAWVRLPEANRTALHKTIDSQIEPIREKAEQVTAIPGLSARIKALIHEILQKLTELTAPVDSAEPAVTR